MVTIGEAVSSLGMLRNMFRGAAGDPLEEEERRISTYAKVKALGEPTAWDRQQFGERLNQIRYNINQYTELIQKAGSNKPVVENLKELLRGYASGLPQEFQEYAKPILAYSPIDPETEAMDKFLKLYPRPTLGADLVDKGRVPDTRTAYAEHDIGMAEWNMRLGMFKNAQLGVNQAEATKQMPRLFATEDTGVYAYRDDMTKQVNFVTIPGDVPSDLIKSAEEKGFGLSYLKKFGSLPMPGWEDGKFVETGGRKYLAYRDYDVIKGEVTTKMESLGAAGGEAEQIPPTAFKIMNMINSGASKKEAKELYPWIERVNNIMAMEVTEEELKTGVSKRGTEWNKVVTEFQNNWGITPILSDEVRSRDWFDIGWDGYHFQGGRLNAVPADRTEILIRDGRPEAYYYNEKVGRWYDYQGQWIKRLNGVMPRSEVPPGVIETTQKKVIKSEEGRVEKATKTLAVEAKRKGIKIKDLLRRIGEHKGGEQIVAEMSKEYEDTKLIDEEFLKDLKKFWTGAGKPGLEALSDIFVGVPVGVINWFLELEV